MINHKGITIKALALFLVLVSLCMEYGFVLVSGGGDGEVRCIEREREALLKFKKGLIDDYGVLSSWGSEDDKKDCCKWKGVVCGNTTGHVIALLLRGHWPRDNYLGGKISSALLELHHLVNLDLSYNDFGGNRIPEFIGSMEKLQHLSFRQCNFSKIVPSQLGNLTNLRTLDLSRNDNIWSENLNWLSHLSLLSRLDLSFTQLRDTNWLQHILKLPSLQELYCLFCGVRDVKPSVGLFVNSSSTSLSILDLSGNWLTSSTFHWLFNLSTSIVSIDLSDNQLDGPIPDAFGKLIFLKHLDLSENILEGGIPNVLGNLSHLQNLLLTGNELTGSVPDLRACLTFRYLYLGGNKLTGSVPATLLQLSELEILDVSLNSFEGIISEDNLMKLHNLKVLDLSFNSLTVHVSPDWSPPFQLDIISLAGCNMGPHFPTWLQTQSNFSWLDLSCTGISGEVPKWLWNLSPIVKYLNLSHNQISGTIPDFSSKLIQSIDVSSNKFSGPIPLFPPNSRVLQFSQNMFSGSISALCTIHQSRLMFLDLSSNQLAEKLPNCWENITRLYVLNLANNNFSGEIPHTLGSLLNLKTLHLCNNILSGELPSTLKNCQSLVLIDIGGNKLTGNIPAWIGANYRNLRHLTFRQNRFYGSIPPEICRLTQIQVLDLSRNNISGNIPQCFNNFTLLVQKNTRTTKAVFFSHSVGGSVYIEDYNLHATFERTSQELNYPDHALVQWKGHELEYRKTLYLLKLIDLSSNRLVGNIPPTFSCLRGLISLNLSRNSLTGNINSDIGKMEMLETLDLTRNQLSGVIPIGLAQLHYLAVLDLANNNLSGKIPSSTQLQSFSASVYAGNSELCGRPLKLCLGKSLSPPFTNNGEHTKENYDGFMTPSFLQEFYITVVLGFILGFWCVVGSLLLKKSWRIAYINFLDDIEDWLYVTTTIFLTKFRRS